MTVNLLFLLLTTNSWDISFKQVLIHEAGYSLPARSDRIWKKTDPTWPPIKPLTLLTTGRKISNAYLVCKWNWHCISVGILSPLFCSVWWCFLLLMTIVNVLWSAAFICLMLFQICSKQPWIRHAWLPGMLTSIRVHGWLTRQWTIHHLSAEQYILEKA